MKELPPKKELILRVELTSKQKEYYKAILTKNYEVLARRNGGNVIACFDFHLIGYTCLYQTYNFFIVLLQISLINVVMELRKLCCHGFMTDEPDSEPANPEEGLRCAVCTCFLFINSLLFCFTMFIQFFFAVIVICFTHVVSCFFIIYSHPSQFTHRVCSCSITQCSCWCMMREISEFGTQFVSLTEFDTLTQMSMSQIDPHVIVIGMSNSVRLTN